MTEILGPDGLPVSSDNIEESTDSGMPAEYDNSDKMLPELDGRLYLPHEFIDKYRKYRGFFKNLPMWPVQPAVLTDFPPRLVDKKGKTPFDVRWSGGVPAHSRRSARKMLGPKVPRSYFRAHMPLYNVLFTGEKGHGKTLSAVQAAYLMYLRGFSVISNGLALSFEDWSFTNFADLIIWLGIRRQRVLEGESVRPVILLFDEAPQWVDARKWEELPEGFMHLLEQQRKYKVYLIVTAIEELSVEKRLRGQTQRVWRCSYLRHTGRIKRELFPPIEKMTDIEMRPIARKRYRPRIGDFERYETGNIIPSPGTIRVERDAKRRALISDETCPNGSSCQCPCGHDPMIKRPPRTAKQHGCICYEVIV